MAGTRRHHAPPGGGAEPERTASRGLVGAGRLVYVAGLVMLAAGVLAGCARQKKLGEGGSVTEQVFYDWLGRDRSPSHYYELVRTSHDERDFCYRCGTDSFIVDKNINAIQRLGDAQFARLEGEAEVVELLTEVLLEDRSFLARSAAAGSLTKMALKLPAYPSASRPGGAERLLGIMRQLDAMYMRGGAPCAPPAGSAPQTLRLIAEIGDLDLDLVQAKNVLRFFYSRPYLVDASDPAMRQTIDTALSKRISILIRMGLRGAVEDPVADVRADALRGLKALDDVESVEVVANHIRTENHFLVRIEAVEYLGRVGTRPAVATLVPMIDDSNASVRHKARQALTRIAGRDLGFRRANWELWARAKDPTIRFADDPVAIDEDGVGELARAP